MLCRNNKISQVKTQAKATVLYSILGFLPMVSSALLFPVNSQFLEPEDYGIVSQANVMIAYIIILFFFGINGLVFRYYLDYSKTKAEQKFFQGHLLLQMLIQSAVILLLLFVVGDWLFDIIWGGGLNFETLRVVYRAVVFIYGVE